MARYICASPQDSFEYNPVEYNTVGNGISSAMSSTTGVGGDDLDMKSTDSSARATSRRLRAKDQSPEVVLVCSNSSLILFVNSPCNDSSVSKKTSHELADEGFCINTLPIVQYNLSTLPTKAFLQSRLLCLARPHLPLSDLAFDSSCSCPSNSPH
jgi:hypothetical protein